MALSEVRLQELLKQIEAVRCQLHEAYRSKKKFSDPEVYQLSVKLDDAIVEYQIKSVKV
jgi:hypothetical protein